MYMVDRGAWSTRSTCAPATPAASSGAWTPSRRRSPTPTAAWRCGAISSSPAPATRRASSPPTRIPARSSGNPTFDRPGRGGDHRGAARRQGQDHRRRLGRRPRRARFHRRARCRDRQAAVAQIHHPGARRARQRDLEGQEQRLADRRRRRLGDRHLRPGQQPDHLGHRQSGADDRSAYAAGRQSLHQQRHLLGSRYRQDELVLPVSRPATCGISTRSAPTSSSTAPSTGSRASSITHSARNGFVYTMERSNGQIVVAKPYMDNINWTKGIDQKTGKPLDYDPEQGHPELFGRRQSDPGQSDQEGLPVNRTAATITGPRPTARGPSCSTSRS